MTYDPFQSFGDSIGDPDRRAFAVTPSDDAELPPLPKALLIGGGGTLVLRPVDSFADVAIPCGPANETNLATATEIVRRFTVSGLAHTGTPLGIGVSGGGAQIRLNGGTYGTELGRPATTAIASTTAA